MTDRQVNALAVFIADGRRDWQPQGIVTALRAARDKHDPWQLAIALIRRATDAGNRTPVLQPFDFDDKPVYCRRHPSSGIRTDGTCAGCFVDAHAAEWERKVNEPAALPSAWREARQKVTTRRDGQ